MDNENGQNNKTWIWIVVAVLIVGAIGFIFLSNNDSTMEDGDDMADTGNGDEVVVDDEEMMGDEEMQTIVEIASSNEDFSTLVTAVTEAGLVETLSGEGPFTVFAPTNAAFEALPEGTLEAVLADQEQLTSILTYHVVSGKVMAEDVVNLTSATTVQGSDVTITVNEDGTVMVNDAMVVTTDIEASNGVIHVIDGVLIPQ